MFEHSNGWALWKCRRCGFIFKTKADVAYEMMPAEYYQVFDFDRSREVAELVRIIRRRFGFTTGLNLIEIGCGTGGLLHEFKKYGMNVFGYEPSFSAVEICKSKFGITTVKNDFFDGATFGVRPHVFLLYDVLEHLKQPIALLEKVKHAMEDDTLFIIKSGNPSSFTARLYPRKWSYFLVEEHVAFYSESALQMLVTQVGLSVDGFYGFRHAHGGFAFCEFCKNLLRVGLNRVVGNFKVFENRFRIGLANDHFIATLAAIAK